MNRDDVIAMAREAAARHGHTLKAVPEQATVEFITELVAMASAAEREACAKLCMDKAHKMEREAADAKDEDDGDTRDSNRATAWVLAVCSQEILARKDEP